MISISLAQSQLVGLLTIVFLIACYVWVIKYPNLDKIDIIGYTLVFGIAIIGVFVNSGLILIMLY